MSNLNPSGASQPAQQQAYETPGNPTQREPPEKQAAAAQRQDNSEAVDKRVPTKQTASVDEATPSSLGRGIRGAPPGEEVRGETEESVGRNKELDGEQMRAPGEGEVAGVVDQKPGATGEQDDQAADMDKKKAEQAPLRNAAKEERKEDVDFAGILGQRGGPANSAD